MLTGQLICMYIKNLHGQGKLCALAPSKQRVLGYGQAAASPWLHLAKIDCRQHVTCLTGLSHQDLRCWVFMRVVTRHDGCCRKRFAVDDTHVVVPSVQCSWQLGTCKAPFSFHSRTLNGKKSMAEMLQSVSSCMGYKCLQKSFFVGQRYWAAATVFSKGPLEPPCRRSSANRKGLQKVVAMTMDVVLRFHMCDSSYASEGK